MKMVLQLLVLVLLSVIVQAKDVSFNGTKPAIIIDVRTAEEFSAGHIDGAINIPYDQIGQGIKSVKGLEKNSPILVYCHSGRRSGIAKTILEQQGFKRILDGGGMETLAKTLKTCTTKTC